MQFSLHQFVGVFRVRDQHGRPYILIGGQAVNYWAERFCDAEPDLLEFRPFTSVDIDFVGNREDVGFLARQLGVRGERFPHPIEMTALSGVIPVQIDGVPATIELVRRVPGLDSAKLQALAVQATWKDLEIRVLDPISLLHAKAHLALSVSQEERRDVHHVKILVYCVRAFLREALEIAEHDPALVRGWLGAVNKTLSLTETTVGSRLSRRFGVNWLGILPRKEIDCSQLPGVIRFRNERLSRWEQKLATEPYQAIGMGDIGQRQS